MARSGGGINDACANCGAELRGAYCAVCGQKRLLEGDRRFGHLLRQFAAALSDLDGRFWGSIRALLFQPGRLSRDYLEGRRKRWMSPIALFLLVNLVFFFFAGASGDFAAPFTWEVPGRIAVQAYDPGTLDAAEATRRRAEPGPFHSRFTAPLVDRRVQARDAAARAASGGRRGYTYRDYRRAYDAKVAEISKTIVILHVPFLAAALMLLFRRSGRYYAEHFVVALHLLAFSTAMLMLSRGMDLLHLFVPPADWHNAALNWLVRAVMTVYTVLALRRVYRVAWHWSIAATAGLFLAYILMNAYLYRPVLFLLVFALT